MRTTLAMMCGAIVGAPAFAAPMTFDTALDAAASGPSVAARGQAVDAARSSAVTARQLPDPKLELGLKDFPIDGPNAGSFTRDNFTMQTIGVAQAFPSLAKRRAQAGRAATDIGAAEAAKEIEERTVRIATALAWVDLHFAEQRLTLLDRLDAGIAALIATAPARLAAGKARPARALEPRQLAADTGDRRAGLIAEVAKARMGIPAVVAAGDDVLEIAAGQAVILDGGAATLDPAPSAAALATARQRLDALVGHRTAARAAAAEDCRMADGTRIEIFANLGSRADADMAIAAGAEGCGLLRTELLFLDRAQPPDRREQTTQYQAIADALAGRPLIIRTLDVGGDKPVDYLDIPREENPALGLRGIRVGLWRPELLEAQLAAMLQVRGDCRILVPMVASLDELLAVRRMIDRLAPASRVPVGVMIETPAAAVTADALAAHADFFAIGTNDLAQYTLAMDRGNPLLAAQTDALHPAVLRLIAQAVQGAARHRRPVGVCGGLASDLVAAAILIGLGVTELSAVPAVIPELKAQVRRLIMADCEELAERAVAASSAAAVRALLPR